MQNFSVVFSIIIGSVNVAIWIGAAVLYVSGWHGDWSTNIKKISDIEERLEKVDSLNPCVVGIEESDENDGIFRMR